MKQWAFWLGPVAGFLVGFLCHFFGLTAAAGITAGVTVLCACWWMLEPVPIPITSLLPLALFPLLGVLTGKQVAAAYGHPLILLLLGGFMLSKSMEKSGAHRRIAVAMIKAFGTHSDRRLIIAFMATAAVLSMWISNTATTLMLLPVALAVLEQAKNKQIVIPLLLGIAYSASLGGIGTPIGTPPNLIFMNVYQESTGIELSFIDWMRWGVPVVILFFPIMALYLTRSITSRQAFSLPHLGSWQTEEKRVMLIFTLIALAWMTRKDPWGGWSTWLGLTTVNDAAVALLGVVIMFIVPNGKGGRLLNWEHANQIPWGVLLLFAGGITIAKAFVASGLSETVGQGLVTLIEWPIYLVILVLCLVVTFLTEMTSNTATTSLLMPILASAALMVKLDPAIFMVPAAISASCAFMLPVATAPNSIIFGSQQVPIYAMMRNGIALNFFGALLISLLCYFGIALT